MSRRETYLIKSGVAQATTGQTTVATTPRWARSAIYQLSVTTAAGTSPLIDYKLRPVTRKITAAPVVATSTAGDSSHNEVQTITLTGGPTGGTFTVTWTGISADITVTTEPISATATAAEFQLLLNRALINNPTYRGEDIVVTRSGSGTSGAPYVYTLTFTTNAVHFVNVDAVTVSGLNLYDDTTISVDYMGWDGITQLTAAGDVFLHVGPMEADTTDDTGTIYQMQSELPNKLAHVVTFDRTTGDETYTWSLYATYCS